MTPTLTVREVAELFRIQPKSVYRWIAKGIIHEDAIVRVGRTIRIRREAVQALYEGRAA